MTDGLKKGGLVVINYPGEAKDTGLAGDFKIATVDATKIALDVLGRPITNTAILGAFAKATGLVTIDSLAESLHTELAERLIPKNAEVMKKAYEATHAPVDASGFKKADMVKKASTQPIISYSRNVSDWRVMRPVIEKAKCVGCKTLLGLLPRDCDRDEGEQGGDQLRLLQGLRHLLGGVSRGRRQDGEGGGLR